MAIIRNKTRSAITLPSGHIIPAGVASIVDGAVAVQAIDFPTTNQVIRLIDNSRFLSGMVLSSQLEVELDMEDALPEAKTSFEAPAVASDQESPVPIKLEPATADVAVEGGAATTESPAAAMEGYDPYQPLTPVEDASGQASSDVNAQDAETAPGKPKTPKK